MKLDDYIKDAFNELWTSLDVLTLEDMKGQLKKSLISQTQGFWSGHSAYKIMVDYGFLIDAEYNRTIPKKLTVLGKTFLAQMEEEYPEDESRVKNCTLDKCVFHKDNYLTVEVYKNQITELKSEVDSLQKKIEVLIKNPLISITQIRSE